MKSSSRAGRFKKKLVSDAALRLEGPRILERLAPLEKLYALGNLSAPDFTAAYVITYLSHRFPTTWPGATRELQRVPGIPWRELPFSFEEKVERRLKGLETLPEILANFALRSTPLAVNRALLNWHQGRYPLELMFRIPRPQEVLRQQTQGRRCVTAITDARVSSYILGERDALSFTMHDLIHADHFYFDNHCYEGQLGFYGLMERTLGYFDLSHEKFAAEFEYVISDMNAYAIHLLKCLKSAMVFYFGDEYFQRWTTNLRPPEALFVLNTPSYAPQTMDAEILDWLSTFRSPVPESVGARPLSS